MRTYSTARCYAEVSSLAFGQFVASVCSLSAEEHLRSVLPDGWALDEVTRDILRQRVILTFQGTDAEWTLAEGAPLPCIGFFTTEGNQLAGAKSVQAADLCNVLEMCFTLPRTGESMEQGAADV